MNNSLSLKERALLSVKQKSNYSTNPDDIKKQCALAFESLSSIKIDHSIAKKQLRSLRGK